MKQKYISPDIRIVKAGTEDFVLTLNVVDGSNGTTEGFAKQRGQLIEGDSEIDNSFWSTEY